MQYKNGRSVSPGHYVIGTTGGTLVAGIVQAVTDKVKIVYPELGRAVYADVNPGDFYHVEDALSAADLIGSGKVIPVVTQPASPATPTTPTTTPATAA